MHSTAWDAVRRKTTATHDTGRKQNSNGLKFQTDFNCNRFTFLFRISKDIENRVTHTLPTLIDKWALAEARETLDKAKKKTLVLPFNQIHNLLVKV